MDKKYRARRCINENINLLANAIIEEIVAQDVTFNEAEWAIKEVYTILQKMKCDARTGPFRLHGDEMVDKA